MDQGGDRAIMRKRRRYLVWLVAAILLLALLSSIAAWLVGGRLVAPAQRDVGDPPPDLHAVVTTLQSDSGSRLAGWHVPCEGSTATVVLLHPIRGDRRSMLGRARLLHEAGYGVVLIDFQAHGESPGNHITAGHLERHDVRAAVEYAQRMNPNHRIGVIGWSLGGAAALLASPLPIDALVLESVYATIEEAVDNRVAMRAGPLSGILSTVLLTQLPLRLGIDTDQLRPIECLGRVDCPVLIVAGELDRHTTLAETQRLFDAAAEPKQLVVFPDAAHGDLLQHDLDHYRRSVLPFLDEHLR